MNWAIPREKKERRIFLHRHPEIRRSRVFLAKKKRTGFVHSNKKIIEKPQWLATVPSQNRGKSSRQIQKQKKTEIRSALPRHC